MSSKHIPNGKLDRDVIDVESITDIENASNESTEDAKKNKSPITLTPQQKTGKSGKLTNADRKEIVVQQCNGFGVNLTSSQISTIIKQSRADGINNRNQFITFARGILQQAIADLEESTREDLTSLANDFIDDMNDSNERFEEDVKDTFRKIQERLAEGNRKSAEAFEAFKAEFNDETSTTQDNTN